MYWGAYMAQATATITLTGDAWNFAENPDADVVIGTLGVVGGAVGETFIFKLGNTFGDIFAIEGGNLLVRGGSSVDFETLNSFVLSISAESTAATDKTLVNDKNFTIAVTDVNEHPVDLTLAGGLIAENTPVGTEVATLLGSDPDAGDVLTYAFVDDQGNPLAEPNAFFEISGNKITLKSGLDQPQVGSHNLWVKVTDAGGFSYLEQITLTVTDSLEYKGGTSRNDKLIGTEFADLLMGGAGNDRIYGLDGDDVINGGTGKDILYGGKGKDTFVFDTPVKKGHFDHVVDFKSVDDTLQFNLAALKSFKVKVTKKADMAGFKKGMEKKTFGLDKVFKKGKLEKKFFTVGDKAKDSNDYVFYNKKKGFVYLDMDGSGSAKAIEILKVKPGTSISADDFLFI